MKNLNKKFNNAFLLSDVDLDGCGALVIAKGLYPYLDFEIPKREDLNDTLKKVINSRKYQTILMTDCSPTGDTIDLINQFVSEGNDFVLLDHHKTALDLNKYSWSKVKVETDGHKHCGTELLYLYFKELGIDVSMFEEFVELVRSYDTWDWYYNGIESANKLNKFYSFLGRDKFIEDMLYKNLKNLPILNSEDEIIINTIDMLDQQYINKEKNNFTTISYEGMKVGVLFTDRCVSLLGNTICQENPELDFCCLIDLNNNKASLRSVVGKADVSVIAKKFGGGGHERASGFYLNNKVREELLKNIFQ